jgi:hypothetical protein
MSYYKDGGRLAHVTLKCFINAETYRKYCQWCNPVIKPTGLNQNVLLIITYVKRAFKKQKSIWYFFRKALYYIYAKGLFFKHNLSILS